MTTTTNKPEHTIRIGSVSASLWKRVGKDGSSVYYTAQVQRAYRTESGVQYTDSFNHDDLFNVIEVVRRAEVWIASRLAS